MVRLLHTVCVHEICVSVLLAVNVPYFKENSYTDACNNWVSILRRIAIPMHVIIGSLF